MRVWLGDPAERGGWIAREGTERKRGGKGAGAQRRDSAGGGPLPGVGLFWGWASSLRSPVRGGPGPSGHHASSLHPRLVVGSGGGDPWGG